MADEVEGTEPELPNSGDRGKRVVDCHHVYYDPKTGHYGLRGDLVVLALWDNEYGEFMALGPEERKAQYGNNSRYFGARKGYVDGVK